MFFTANVLAPYSCCKWSTFINILKSGDQVHSFENNSRESQEDDLNVMHFLKWGNIVRMTGAIPKADEASSKGSIEQVSN